jgi:lysozyme family protein
MTTFDTCIEYTLKREGGLADDKDDEGGITKFGITQTSLTLMHAIGRYTNVPTPKELTIEEAIAIYEKLFWKNRWNEIHNLFATQALFDFGVVCGNIKSIKIMQMIVGAKIDGKFGPDTLGRINVLFDKDYADFEENKRIVVTAHKTYYLSRAMARSQNQKFLNGWLKRCDYLMAVN